MKFVALLFIILVSELYSRSDALPPRFIRQVFRPFRGPWGQPQVPPPTTGAPVLVAGAISGCDCPTTAEFNPVCGTDGNTYGNMQKLNCARMCGQNTALSHLGTCVGGLGK